MVGVDPATDLAVCQVNTQMNVPFAQLGDSSNLLVGQVAIGMLPLSVARSRLPHGRKSLDTCPLGLLRAAMGNPLGFSSSVSAGVISAVGRSIMGVAGNMIEDVIQVLAAWPSSNPSDQVQHVANHFLPP